MGTHQPSNDETAGRIRLAVRAGVPVVSMVGEFDLANADQLRACLAWLETLPCDQVVIDMGETEFIDSTTLGTLVFAHRNGVRVAVTGASGERHRALEICGLSAVFAIPS